MAASGSVMKEYVRCQLLRWVDDFQDEMLPRDFSTKPHAHAQLTFAQIRLKPHRVAELLHLQPPLLVTRVFCVELTVTVPSYADKGPQKPVLVHMTELHVDVKNAHECRSKVRREAEERARSAMQETDPLGAVGAEHAFTLEINECVQITVDAICIQMFMGGVPRVQFVLENFYARATDALWQDVDDASKGADSSPDNMVRTRFKCLSFTLSVSLSDSSCVPAKAVAVLDEVPVIVRMTLLCHRTSVDDAWGRYMQLVDVDFGMLRLAVDAGELFTMYAVGSTLWSWFLADSEHESESSGVISTQEEARGDITPDGCSDVILLRGGLEAMLTFQSPSQGSQEVFLTVENVVVNAMEYRSGKRQLELSMSRLAVMLQERFLLQLKPDREVLSLELHDSKVLVKWQLQALYCAIDNEQASILMEVADFFGEQEKVAAIKCGTCRQQIHLEMIDSHICRVPSSRSLPSSPMKSQAARTDTRRNSISECSSVESSDHETNLNGQRDDSVVGPKTLRVVFQMKSFELQIGSRLANILLLALPMPIPDSKCPEDLDIKMIFTDFRVTTESTEFLGDAVFVPVIPMAFQMLECILRGCGCISSCSQALSAEVGGSSLLSDSDSRCRWPTQLFLNCGKCSITAQSTSIVMKVSLTAEILRACYCFSDSRHICLSSQPQLSFHVDVRQVGCELTESCYDFIRRHLSSMEQFSFSEDGCIVSTLFLGVLQIHRMEIIFQHPTSNVTPAKRLLQQVEVVFDNQLGFLNMQSSLNVQMLLRSRHLHFELRQPSTAAESMIPQWDRQAKLCPDTQDISLDRVTEAEHDHAGRCIQRLYRQYRQRSLTRGRERGSIKSSEMCDSIAGNDGSERDYSPASSVRSLAPCSQGVPSPIKVADLDEDFEREKSVSSALREGLSKFALPIRRKSDPAGMTNITQTLEAPAPLMMFACHNLSTKDTTEATDQDEPLPVHLPKTQEVRLAEVNEGSSREVNSPSSLNATDDDAVTEPTLSAFACDAEVVVKQIPMEDLPSEVQSPELPVIVRVLVQVRECRLCVPIHLDANVGDLCHEVIRRFNESFGADKGEISAVSLQDKHGGVFSPSDSMEVILAVAPNELFFAYPHGGVDGEVRSLARVTAGTSKSAQRFGDSSPVPDEKSKLLSKIPLTLALALLANVPEGDLAYSEHSGAVKVIGAEQWPELAINASFLNPGRRPLQVEVVWHDKHMEVADVDAFALCLQQLGLTASRVSTRHADRILRERLKIDAGPSLAAHAFRPKGLLDHSPKESDGVGEGIHSVARSACDNTSRPQSSEHMKEALATYENLKRAVQGAFGVYTR